LATGQREIAVHAGSSGESAYTAFDRSEQLIVDTELFAPRR